MSAVCSAVPIPGVKAYNSETPSRCPTIGMTGRTMAASTTALCQRLGPAIGREPMVSSARPSRRKVALVVGGGRPGKSGESAATVSEKSSWSSRRFRPKTYSATTAPASTVASHAPATCSRVKPTRSARRLTPVRTNSTATSGWVGGRNGV